jgi:hypothetical protein
VDVPIDEDGVGKVRECGGHGDGGDGHGAAQGVRGEGGRAGGGKRSASRCRSAW